VTSREVIAALNADGWMLDRVTGSHHIFRHPAKTGTMTVPQPRKDLPIGTLKSIERQTGIKLR
jgi:predicted RNA binding protein YcfA (HicA-like mRNA interferase family)